MKQIRSHRLMGSRRGVLGMSMIEVLIALLILVFGVLGIAALQMTALRNSQSSMQHSLAVQHAYGAIDRMRADVSDARIGSYNLGNYGTDLGPGGSGTTVWTCALPDVGALPENERREWIGRLQADLGPQACGIIDCNDLACYVGVKWDDSRGSAGTANKIVTTGTRL